ncbi:MAG: 30S ribosomal protein S8 [Nitrospirae bacterium]|nr:30S ribosomal protein S8 [Nitrospirota bacterium]MBI5694908.1 30S ribosomal protein S8 [Nitrospirota bacterium]
MGMTDPIADMLTRIRNANMAKLEKLDIPSSNLKLELARVLKDEGYIKNFKLLKDRKQGIVRVYMKYSPEEVRVINGLKRVSSPGNRVYVGADEIPRVMGGMGVAILSTSKGVMADRESRKQNIGGEVLCYIW